MATQADGMAERDAAMLMLYAKWRDRRRSSNATVTVGADKAYDTKVSAQRWSLGLQHMFPLKFMVEASYVGNRNTRLNINRELSYTPAQYFSTSPVRDQATIDALGRTSPNPYSGLNPIYGTVISRGSLLRNYSQFSSVRLLAILPVTPGITHCNRALSGVFLMRSPSRLPTHGRK